MTISGLVANIGGGVFGMELTLFFSTFTTLLAVINPFEVLPVFLMLQSDKSDEERRRVGDQSIRSAACLPDAPERQER